jgi:3-hydroxyacyl-[acyl-carrier protein] dehydratase / trans-2-decenoyl-[acyl-carrier protein] isomerase
MVSLIDLNETFLPIGQMRQITAVTAFYENTIVCEMDLGHHWTYPMHFPDDPILPGCLMIEAAGQVTALWAWLSGQRGKPRLVKTAADFRAPAGPEHEVLTFRAKVKKKRFLNFGTITVLIGDTEIATIENCLAIV